VLVEHIAELRARRDLKRTKFYLDANNLTAALAVAESCVARFPRLPEARYWFAMALLAGGRYREAIAQLEDASRLDPARPGYFAALARAQMGCGDHHFAMASAMRAVALNPVKIPLLEALARILQRGGEYEQALLLLDQALLIEPSAPELLLSRAFVLRAQGRLPEAEAVFEKVLAVAPENARAHWGLAQVSSLGPTHNHLARIEARASQLDDSTLDRVWLDYARYLELEALGRDQEAIAALLRGAGQYRRSLALDAESNARIFSRMRGWQQAWERQTDKVHAAAAADEAPTPIFIIGMPRAGGTLIERMLGNHPDVRHGGERHDFAWCVKQELAIQREDFLDEELAGRLGELDWAALARRYRQRLTEQFGPGGFVTEKLPANYIYAGVIARALPEARIVHIVRDPLDNCFSLFRQMYSGVNPFSFDQIELARHYVAYDEWMRHLATGLPDRMLNVRYEQLVAMPALVGRAIYRFCGLQWSDQFADPSRNLRPVAVPGSVRVDEPLHARFVGRWRRYEDALQEMQRVLAGAGLVRSN
jgi:tetratricopeptide (TPR) repeat protein